MDGVSAGESSVIFQAFTSIGEDLSPPPAKKAGTEVDISHHKNTNKHNVYSYFNRYIALSL